MSPIPGEAAALGTALCWSFTSLFFAYAGRRVTSPVVNRSRLLFATLLLMTAHLVLQGTLLPWGAEPFRWRWLAFSGLLGLVLGDAALFQAFVLIGPRLSMLLMSLVPIMSLALGWSVFGETASAPELAGMLMAIAGVSWVVTEKKGARTGEEDRNYRLGITLGLIGAVGQAANLATAKYGLIGGFPTVSATLIRILVAVSVMWLLAVLRGQVGRTVDAWGDRRALTSILGGSTFGPFMGVWLSMYAVQNARLGIASTLMALPPVLLIPIERIAFGERVSSRGTAGTLLAFAGVALIFMNR